MKALHAKREPTNKVSELILVQTFAVINTGSTEPKKIE